MSGLPPINLQSNKMLPAVYRRFDVTRQVTISGQQSSPGPRGEQLVDVSNNGYNHPLKNCAAPVSPGAVYPKGIIVDVWT
jgi:hypothetical protein